MAFGPEFVYGIADALNKKFCTGARVTRVEGGDTWIALKTGREWLLLSWSAGVAGCCFADDGSIAALSSGAPSRTPMVEALKSRAVRGDLVAARQINHDRVLEFTLRRRVAAGTGVSYTLVLEATEPVGNFLVLDETGTIEAVARHAAPSQNSFRTLLPGHKYVTPPVFAGLSLAEFDKVDKVDNERVIVNGDKLFESIVNLTGIGRPLGRWIRDRWNELTPDEWLTTLRAVVDNNSENNNHDGNKATCFMIGKNYLTRLGLDPRQIESVGSTGNNLLCVFDSILTAAAHGVLRPMLERGRERRLHEVETRLKRVAKSRERHRDGLRKQLKDCAEAEVYRHKGELLLAHLHEITPAILRAGTVTLSDWYAPNDQDAQVQDSNKNSGIVIALDQKLSPSKNAERYFKKYRKAHGDADAIRSKLDALEGALAELAEQKDLLESVGLLDGPERFEEAVRDVESWLDTGSGDKSKSGKSNKRREVLPPHLVYEFEDEGLVVLVGLSARGNRHVTFREARSGDIWLHAHEVPGAHVVIRSVQGRSGDLRTELENECRGVLEFAAAMAAGHSKGRNSAMVAVDYTERRHVRAVPGTVALVTYTEPGTIRVRPATGDS